MTPAVDQPERAKRDGKITVLIALGVLTACLIGLVIPFALNSSSGTDAIQRNTDVTGCRSAANADLTDARNTADQARDLIALIQNDFNQALANGDLPAVEALRPQFAPAKAALLEAGRVRDEKNTAYQEAITLSREDPDAFLRQCRSGDPLPTTSSTALHGAIGEAAPTSTTEATTTTSHRTQRRTTRPTTTTAGTTTTVYPSAPRPTTPSTTCLVPRLLPEVPCL